MPVSRARTQMASRFRGLGAPRSALCRCLGSAGMAAPRCGPVQRGIGRERRQRDEAGTHGGFARRGTRPEERSGSSGARRHQLLWRRLRRVGTHPARSARAQSKRPGNPGAARLAAGGAQPLGRGARLSQPSDRPHHQPSRLVLRAYRHSRLPAGRLRQGADRRRTGRKQMPSGSAGRSSPSPRRRSATRRKRERRWERWRRPGPPCWRATPPPAIASTTPARTSSKPSSQACARPAGTTPRRHAPTAADLRGAERRHASPNAR